MQIDPQSVVDGSEHFLRTHRSVSGLGCRSIGRSHHLASYDPSTRKQEGPAERPMIASAGWIDLWCASELTHRYYQSLIQESSIVEIF